MWPSHIPQPASTASTYYVSRVYVLGNIHIFVYPYLFAGQGQLLIHDTSVSVCCDGDDGEGRVENGGTRNRLHKLAGDSGLVSQGPVLGQRVDHSQRDRAADACNYS